MTVTNFARLTLVATIVVALPVLLRGDEMRTWTNSTGKLTLEAELIQADQDSVVLKRASDGKRFKLQLTKLSKADQDYIRSLKSDSGATGATGPTTNRNSRTAPKNLPIGTELIEVISDTAQVKIGKNVIATVKRGEQFALLGREGPWLAISITTQEGEREGWIFATRVRYSVGPGLTQESDAPGPYEVVTMDVDKTQFSAKPTTSLLCELTLSNRGLIKAEYDVASLTLQVENQTFQPSAAPRMITAYQDGKHPARIGASQFLLKGEIAPGDSVTGWVRFEVPQIADVRVPLPKRWVLAGMINDRKLEHDLIQGEIEQVGKTRPSTLDPSIEVLELGSRINLLNVGKLLELLVVLQTKNEPYVVVAANENCYISDLARQRFRSQGLPRSHAQSVCVGMTHELARALDLNAQPAESESTATVIVAAMRPTSGVNLIQHLSNPSPETRATTAYVLSKSISEPGVVEALLQAAADDHPRVRAAVARVLGGSADATRVCKRLLPLLDDSNSRVVISAAASLGQLKCKEAVLRLQQLAADNKHPAAASATDALKVMGTLTEVDAAIRKLDLGRPSPEDFAALAKTKDERVVGKLIDLLQSSKSGYQINPIAETLGEIGDLAAVAPLLEKLSNTRQPSQDVARALGKLGDKRAMAPLQRALLSAPREDSFDSFGGFGDDFRSAAHEALLMLDAPGATDQLLVELKQTRNQNLLKVLGRSGGVQAVASVAPFLDDAKYSENATAVLLAHASDEALEEIRKRLLDEDSQHVEEMASALSNCRSMLSGRRFDRSQPLTGVKADDPKGKRLTAFLKEMESSPHAEVREAVR